MTPGPRPRSAKRAAYPPGYEASEPHAIEMAATPVEAPEGDTGMGPSLPASGSHARPRERADAVTAAIRAAITGAADHEEAP